MVERDVIKGDKLHELMLLVHLNSKYGLGTTLKLFKLKKFLDYSPGGLYGALEGSGYFSRKGDEIELSDKGERYVNRKLMAQLRALYSISYFLLFFGIVLIVHWHSYTYHKIFLIFPWTVGLSFIGVGLLIRFGLLPLGYWLLKVRRKV